MILSYKHRTPRAGERVKVYRNLRDGGGVAVWSIVARRDGRNLVVGHADELVLREVSFLVSEAGRARVLTTGRKNTHAYAVGRLGRDGEQMYWSDTSVHYDPFRSPSFIDATGEPIDAAKKVYFDQLGKVWAQ